MNIKIDTKICTGCGLCEDQIPELFKMGDYVAEVLQADLPEGLMEHLQEIIEDCPSQAISLYN